MSSEGSLHLIIAALKEFGGYFVWADDDGEEYIIMSRREHERRLTASSEEQLELLSRTGERMPLASPKTADDMLEKINHDLALYHLQREEEEGVNPTEVEVESESTGLLPLPPKDGKRVRFEPLRGDLAPELQD